jgi:rhamnose utilization protein RhaD (predicted bifunctional aldolase and dehydrogenase)
MTTQWNPAVVGDELLTLTNRLGEPALDLVILAEGNTSELLEDDLMAVKASGAYMSSATREDFVTVNISEVIAIIEDPAGTQSQLTEVLDAGEHNGARRRGSIETLVHASVRAFTSARFVAHTHPTPVISLLASVHAEDAFAVAAYSDEAVVIGAPLFVPYAPPGLELGRAFHSRLRAHVDEHGSVPPLILLGNHGIVATSDTSAGVEAISMMSVKAARVRIGAYAVGGVAGLNPEHVAAYWTREDFAERRGALSGRPGDSAQ